MLGMGQALGSHVPQIRVAPEKGELNMENDATVGWIAAIVIGGIAGWLAEQFMKSNSGHAHEHCSRHRWGDRCQRYFECCRHQPRRLARLFDRGVYRSLHPHRNRENVQARNLRSACPRAPSKSKGAGSEAARLLPQGRAIGKRVPKGRTQFKTSTLPMLMRRILRARRRPPLDWSPVGGGPGGKIPPFWLEALAER